jgi:hypothetical protein
VNELAEQVIPVRRTAMTFIAVGCAALVILGLFAPFWRPTLLGYVSGVGCVVLFGIQLYWWVRTLLTPGLRMTNDGFGFGGWTWSWADVEGFEPRGKLKSSAEINTIKVVLNAGAVKGFERKAAEMLGRLGLFGPPAYIYARSFDAAAKDTLEALEAWHARFGAAAR